MSLEIQVLSLPSEAERAEVVALAPSFEPAWYTSLNADQARPAWFLARRAGVLVGFLTVFDPSGNAAEVSAFVAPAQRRQGVFSALFARAWEFWNAPTRRWLLVVDRLSESGSRVAARLGFLAFTESTLSLKANSRPLFMGLPAPLTLSQAGPEDVEAILAVQDRASGEDSSGYREFLTHVLVDPSRRMLVLHSDGRVVGAVGLAREEGVAELFGLAVAPEVQGRGWGRALVQGILELEAAAVHEFRLEVDSTNARAEKLYRSLGFQDCQVTDYYQLPSTTEPTSERPAR